MEKSFRAPQAWFTGRVVSRAVCVSALVLLGFGVAPAFASSPISWLSPISIDGSHLLDGISCPSTRLCAAVDDSGNVITSTDPTGGFGTWDATAVDPGAQLYGVSCPANNLCVAVDNHGDVLTTSDPSGGAAAWQKAALPNATMLGLTPQAVSCPAGLCVVTANQGYVFTSANPGGGTGAWSDNQVDGTNTFNGVSCPSSGLCVAGDGNHNIMASTSPGAGFPWAQSGTDSTDHVLDVSCSSTGMCVAVDDQGNVLSSANPATGPWTPATISAGNELHSISCPPSETLCVAVGASGYAFVSTDPGDGVSAWGGADIDGSETMYGVSCASTLLCVAVDGAGNAVIGSAAPLNIQAPTISGHDAESQTLTEAHGSWTGSPISYGYQWEDCNSSGGSCVAIPNATSQTHALSAGDVGHTIRVTESATNSGGSVDPVASAATGVVQGVAVQPTPTGAASVRKVTVSGTTASVLVSCSGGSCQLTIELTVTETIKRGTVIVVSAARKKTKVMIIGRANTTLAAGQHKTIKMALNRTGKQLLSKYHHLKVKLAVSQTRGGTSALAFQKTISFHSRKKRRR
jgi:hypothetical protein